ncbi:MAG TPA: GNAT family N-acetyltransferase [Streptosporangiaceae bacterium]|nr:GNAT family N-acetyltransferase [Streptosporangiaceae bacterium]
MTTSVPRGDPPYPIRPVSSEEFDAFHTVDMHAFHGSPLSPEERQLVLSHLEFDRSLAAFDGDTPVGTAGAYTFQLTVPGSAALPAAGVTWVSVLPSHRRRGVLSSLMRRQLADIRGRGEPVAVLWASESVIYSRFGYGRAMWHADFTLYRGEGTLARTAPAAGTAGSDGGLRLRLVDPVAAVPELAKVYDAVLPSRPGFIARIESWWQRTVYDPAARRQGTSPLHCVLAEDDGGPRGYALYSAVNRWDSDTSLPDSTLNVREMVAADAAASAALAADLLSRDLTTEFRLRGRPVDDPLLYQLADPRRARPQLKDALWVRIIDVPGALARRRYSAPADVVLEVRDDLLTANAGRWRLTTTDSAEDGGGLSATCVPSSSAPDVLLDVTQLGAAYLGGTTLGALAGAGLVTEGRPGAVRQLSTALSWDPAPWCPVNF